MRAIVAVLVIAWSAIAAAQPAKPKDRPTGPKRRVVVAPLATVGAEDTSAQAKQIQADLEKAIAEVGGVLVLDSKAALAEIKKAKRPDLRVCEGEVRCLTELGKLVGADLVVAGEAGGLGSVNIVYLELVDVAKKKSVRSTTLEIGDKAKGGALGAAYRLLAPEAYGGTMTLAVDTAGATIYVDGKRVGRSPASAIPLGVGTHALRVTHPEYRDFVRFVDVGFQADTKIPVALQGFPIIETEVKGTGKRSNITYVDQPAPWYRKWWAIATFSGVVLIAAAATAGIIADGVDADAERPVTPDGQ